MISKVELFYDFLSPYSYLALKQLHEMNAPMTLKPIQILKVMDRVGNVPTSVTCAAKSRYTQVDLERCGQRCGISFNRSDMMGNNTKKMSRAVLAAATPSEATAVSLSLYRAIFSEGKTLKTKADIVGYLGDAGIDASRIENEIDSSSTRDLLDANTDEAVRRGVFGSPTMFVGEAMFFGNDRIEFVREELSRIGEGA